MMIAYHHPPEVGVTPDVARHSDDDDLHHLIDAACQRYSASLVALAISRKETAG